LGTVQAIRVFGAHTGADKQCTDAMEAGVGANGPARIHMGSESRHLGRAKGGDGAAYVMPDWAGRMASVTCTIPLTKTKSYSNIKNVMDAAECIV